MKEIFVVDSYPDNKLKMINLAVTVDKIKGAGFDCAVVSHLPIDRFILADFVLYDRNNPLSDNFKLITWHTFDDLKIVHFEQKRYHGVTVYTNICNAARFFSGLYDVVHFVEADVVMDYKGYAELAKGFSEYDVFGYQYFEPGISGAGYYGIMTNFFSFKPHKLLNLPLVRTWAEYIDMPKTCEEDRILEVWFKKQLDSLGLRMRILAPEFQYQNVETSNQQSRDDGLLGDSGIRCFTCDIEGQPDKFMFILMNTNGNIIPERVQLGDKRGVFITTIFVSGRQVWCKPFDKSAVVKVDRDQESIEITHSENPVTFFRNKDMRSPGWKEEWDKE